ncbi:hypothetical protein GCM10017786_04360 [Amycolatopsis deserti]|uniref:YbaB/EbfC DNA-binding family protein n=1 Tax=Amycolatopsis deserti TaxID=185696 RepID=A0ABQ3IH75_9PSEU|nr:YbaB/EbfC family nucleoid-associated protein [Amycolatopsis deserti]GHE77944.1 hypothetical protein GCM10017786_04360 [Amycolatopsis deserti]
MPEFLSVAGLSRELDTHRTSALRGAVRAEVDGHGNLVGLELDAVAVRGAHPQVLGGEIVRAVAAARAAASERRRRALASVLPGMPS